jgi:hypothetical protein
MAGHANYRITLEGLFAADFNGGSVAEAVRIVRRTVAGAFFHGHFDPGASGQQRHVPSAWRERILTVYYDFVCLLEA